MAIQNMSVQRVYTINADGTKIHRLISTTGYNAAPTWSPDGKLVAFESNRSGNEDLYTMRPDGSRVSRLTHDGSSNGNPAWSPDGTQIAYASNWKGQGVYVMRADGRGERKIASTPGIQVDMPAWSRDGRWVLFAGDSSIARGGLYAVHPDGTGLQQLVPGDVSRPAPDPRSPSAALSQPRHLFELPTGIAIDGRGDLFVANLAPLGTPGFVEELTPGGRRVAVQQVSNARAIAIGAGGHLFVTNQHVSQVLELSPRLRIEHVWAIGNGGQVEGVLVDK
jgi:dipeptidyl aminopeptidase/acylaminoacyl peptidase